jgi:type IX secretion system PorP/SprF family membrane protein
MVGKHLHIVILIFSLFALAEKKAGGQELHELFPRTMQYMSNMHTINPAFVGMWDRAGFMLSTRKDYVTINGAKLYQQFTYNMPIRDRESGVGVNFIRRTVGFEKQLSLTFDYSYQVRLDMYYYLRFGLRMGVVNYSPNLTDYHLYPDGIPDTEFLTDISHQFMTAVGFGAVLYDDKYYVSLSVPQFVSNTFQLNRTGYSSLQEFKTAYLSTGYLFNLPMSIMLRPNILFIGSIGRSVRFDVASVVYLPNNLQFGVNIRSNGSSCFSGQYTFGDGLRIGFAADYAFFQDIRNFQFGTYEIMVGYDFNIYRKSSRPTYF